jgi:hydroxymethylbilane synthase
MPDSIRIGTRNSPLAIWQAEYVKEYLSSIHVDAHLVFIKSEGEYNLTVPLYDIGIQGIFTKSLDIALLENRIDIAVHSLKDVPTSLADGLEIACIPQRANPSDTLVYKTTKPEHEIPFTVATSSLRRKAQWLHKFSNFHITDSVRGNINTRLHKLLENDEWDGIIFATAGLDRINLQVPQKLVLDWMIPAPAQGALAVMSRISDPQFKHLLSDLHCQDTSITVNIERSFLRAMEGGCTMPIGAFVNMDAESVHLRACLLDQEGDLRIDVDREFDIHHWQEDFKILLKETIQTETYIEIKRRLNEN